MKAYVLICQLFCPEVCCREDNITSVVFSEDAAKAWEAEDPETHTYVECDVE